MNYIELIKTFWRAHEEHSFKTTEIALYLYLIEVCNICRWKNPFRRNNAKTMADLSISFNTLKNARNKLFDCGLIEFETLNGSPNVIYTLSNFDKVSSEVVDKVEGEVSNEVLTTKDKLNKTKTKRGKALYKLNQKGGNNDINIIGQQRRAEFERLYQEDIRGGAN